MLGIVTATTNIERAEPCLTSWEQSATHLPMPLVIIQNGGTVPYLGTVRAFRQGVDLMLASHPEVDLIACLHDDVLIHEEGWDDAVERCFRRHPQVGLVGFGGAIGLGTDDLYQAPYEPIQLARIGYRSNTVDAETHGTRSLLPERVVCLDGFSQIGRRQFWQGLSPRGATHLPPWDYLELEGFVHHFYDGALGCLAARYGWQVYYLPIHCRHLGGQTAVGDPGYQRWAAAQINGGDLGFWEQAHRTGYDLFRDVLPLRVTARERDVVGPADSA